MHNIHTEDYPLKVNRASVQKHWDRVAAYEDRGEGCCGLGSDIRWLENQPVCESYEDAQKLIEKLDNGWYDQLAVRYKEYKPNTTKRYADMKKRLQMAKQEYTMKAERQHYSPSTVTSAFVGCKECKSSISVKHLHSNRCPVCGADLRPKSTLQNIENARKKIDDLRKALADEEKKGKYEVRWLVKIEYHT